MMMMLVFVVVIIFWQGFILIPVKRENIILWNANFKLKSNSVLKKCLISNRMLLHYSNSVIVLILWFILGVRILFIRIMKLKNIEILFFKLSPAFHHLEFLLGFIPKKLTSILQYEVFLINIIGSEFNQSYLI